MIKEFSHGLSLERTQPGRDNLL